MALVTLITDFGTADGYAGEMKGVLLSGAPNVRVVDITHDIPPGDVEAAAWVLGRCWERYPPGTVHLVVVDPGVGGPRMPIAARAAGRWFVGPDNGCITRVARRHELAEARRLAAANASATFHGRDVFAPAAAALASDEPPQGHGAGGADLDPRKLVRLELPEPEWIDGEVRGRVEHEDRFGNLITNVPAEWLPPRFRVRIGGEVVAGPERGYVNAREGALLALVGSGQTLEVALRDGSAARRLAVGRGEPVSVSASGESPRAASTT